MMTEAHIKVIGRVQGVGFRYFTIRNANDYGLKGYVRNLTDGSVEIRVEGEKEVIEQFNSVIKAGSGFSDVKKLEIAFKPYTAKFTEFSVEY